MIHILFMILKALGILLLVLLFLVLLIVCTVLFLPFCYRAQVLKEEEGFACVKASGRVSWLFGAVALTASYEEQKPEAQILLFGASLETWKRRLKKIRRGEASVPRTEENETENAPEAEKTAEQKAEAKKEQTSAEQPAEQKTDTVKKNAAKRRRKDTESTGPDRKTAEGDSTEGAARARAGTGCAEKKHSGTVFRKDRISSGKTAESCQPSAADSFPAVGTSVPSA